MLQWRFFQIQAELKNLANLPHILKIIAKLKTEKMYES